MQQSRDRGAFAAFFDSFGEDVIRADFAAGDERKGLKWKVGRCFWGEIGQDGRLNWSQVDSRTVFHNEIILLESDQRVSTVTVEY